MVKRLSWISVLLLFTLILAGCFALAEPEASSGPVAAPTLAAAVPTDQPTSEPALAEPTAVPEDQTAETNTAVPAAGAGSTVYDIDPSRSEARFTIDEVLRGSDNSVVGVSSNLAGQIAFDINDPAATEVGEILIDARDFATDNDFRNRAIANRILLTNTYEYVTFTPKELVGLPDSVVVGETYEFQIVGDLTIIGETREVTFDVTVTPVSETELQGLASTTISYADFGVTVPLSQAVSAVSDQVLLELDFVAVAQ
ncbi:MAG: YceI family protein [Anaerolineae bacterium]